MSRSASQHASPHRIADIEMLRGIAVLAIIVYHAHGGLASWPTPIWDRFVKNYFDLWPGVDIFFAISGFVIARSLLPSLRVAPATPAFVRASLVFWIRRVWRLLPSAWLWLAVILVGSAVLVRTHPFDIFHANFESVIAALLSMANFRLADAFKNYAYGASSPYWSLSLEEQFYFLLPFVVFFSGRHFARVLVAATVFMFMLPETPLLMMVRLHAIILGVLLALFSETQLHALFEPTALAARPWLRVATLAGLLAVMMACAPSGEHITLCKIDVIAVLAAALVFLASYDRDYLCPDCLAKRVLLWVGSRSYALYLIHVVAFGITREAWAYVMGPGTVFGPQDGWRLAWSSALVLGCLAEMNYRFVEVPCRARGLRLARSFAQRPIGGGDDPPSSSGTSTGAGESGVAGETQLSPRQI